MINFTYLHDQLKGEDYIKGTAPRWIFEANATTDNLWAVSNLIVIDSVLENKYGFGRNLKLETLSAYDCYITESLAKSLFLKVNDTINMKLRLTTLLKNMAAGDFANSEEDDRKKQEQAQIKAAIKSQKQAMFTIPRSPKLNNTYDQVVTHSPFIKLEPPIVPNITEWNLSNKPRNRSEQSEDEAMLLRRLITSDDKLSNMTIPFEFNSILKRLFDIEIVEENSYLIDFFLNSEYTKSLGVFKLLKEMIKNSILLDIEENFMNSSPLIFNEKEDKLHFNFKNAGNSLNKTLHFNMTRMLLQLPDEKIKQIGSFELKLNIKQIIGTSTGKWPSLMGNVIAVDAIGGSEYIAQNLATSSISLLSTYTGDSNINPEVSIMSFKNSLKNFTLYNYAMTANVVLKDKFSIYKEGRNGQRKMMSNFTGRIVEKLGYDYPVEMQVPLYLAFEALEIVKIFMTNILQSVMIFLYILSFILIYSLMLGNVDERNYEFGMLRALGFKKKNLITMIIFQALIFAIPAIILSLIVATIGNELIGYFLFNWTGIIIDYNLNVWRILWGIFVGISIPLCSSYFPIKKALSFNLKDSLTVFSKRMTDITVNIMKLGQLGISPVVLICAILLVVMGFATYYIAPLSFLLFDMSIFIFLLNLILIVMILGLIFVLQMFIPYMQRAVLELIMLIFWGDRNVKFVVIKNLEGHSKRNQKTSIMFMIALSFVIFAGCTLKLIANFIISLSKNIYGGDVFLTQGAKMDSLDQIVLSNYLNEFNIKFKDSIKSYTYISYPIDEILSKSQSFGPLCGYPSKGIDLVTVDQKFLQTLHPKIYNPVEYNKNLTFEKYDGQVNIFSGLYLNNGSNSKIERPQKSNTVVYPKDIEEYSNPLFKDDLLIIAPEGLRKRYSVDLYNYGLIKIEEKKTYNYPAKIIAFASKIPGFITYSSYWTIAEKAQLITSEKQMKDVIEHLRKSSKQINETMFNHPASYKTPDSIPKKSLIIKFEDHTNLTTQETMLAEIKNIMNNDDTKAYFINDVMEASKTVSFVMEIFFTVIGTIALTLSFFLIWTSFYCNIKDNICEYGIMR
jgi:ABC-type antimicrobial peptide transport system permease subunit